MSPQDGPAAPGSQTSEQAVDAWLFALQNLVAARSPLTGRLYRRLAERTEYTPQQRVRLERLAPWAERIASPAPAPAVAADEIPFGIIGYGAPDYAQASRNVGDWVQTVAMTSHIVRRPDVKLAGDRELVGVLEELRAGVPSENLIEGPAGTLKLVEVNRDASAYDSIPPGTWAIVFGWFMKTPFGRKAPFPLNDRIRPIFLSFHISRADFLRPEVVEYLRANGPVGCRDWYTTRLLSEAGVPAYFSGCVTTTVGRLFPPHVEDPTKPVAYVDVKVPDDAGDVVTLTNLDNSLRNGTLVHGLKAAIHRLGEYRNDFSKVVTSRLHTLLPSWSLGVPVEWQPGDPNDRRFGGLAGPTAEPREQMAARISEIARVILDAILAGKSEEDVYATYRAEVAKDVAATAARLEAESTATVTGSR